MKRVHLLISGKVQGVFFRYNVDKIAKKLGLHGFVKNTMDGKVEVVAEGSEDKLRKLIKFCEHGPEHAMVDGISTKKQEYKKEFSCFEIRY